MFAAADALLDALRGDGASRRRRSRSSPGCSGRSGGRRRIFARLGLEAADALEEFLELALDYERREPPSLQGFVAWLRAADAVVKRDMEIERDEVRVMTVHGAKGLEAPVVILADTTTPPAGPATSRACWRCRGRRPRRTRRPASSGPAARRTTSQPSRRRARAARDGSRGRASPAALCRDDARRRAADRLRLSRRKKRAGRAAGTTSSSADLPRARASRKPARATHGSGAIASRRDAADFPARRRAERGAAAMTSRLAGSADAGRARARRAR